MTIRTPNNAIRAFRFKIVAVILCAILPIASACAQAHTDNVQLGTPVAASLMQTLELLSTDSLDTATLPDHVTLLHISGPPVHKNGAPTVLYMGSDFCPYCASLRWPLVLALMRFGDFSDLKYMRSASSDVYANTVTFSFHGANYHSDYIHFESVELQDRERNPLERPNARQIEIFRTFDVKPYTNVPGAIPFLYMDGQYMQSGSPFSPGILQGLSWQAVADQLSQTDSSVRQTIMGVTNLYTAAMCQLTDGEPARVCSSRAVNAAAKRLPTASE